jgi:YHS domain-containing protein
MTIDRGGAATALLILSLLGVMGGLAYQAQKVRPPRRPHNHAHATTDRGLGGHNHVVSLGNDEYHVEVVLATDGKLYLFTLGADETRVQTVPAEPLPALVKGPGDPAAVAVTFDPAPQAGDPPGTTSRFAAAVPAAVTGRPLELTVPNLAVEGNRFRFTIAVGPADHAAEMPAKVTDDEEKKLYLNPGGLYTLADIAANGRLTASEKFKGFRAKHDAHPKAGDRLCPVTDTKAHPDCAWVVGGKTYTFCCPPCVDEFVRKAKERPDEVKPPESYVQPP